jgi:aerobic carbon-monoxide dehydrogenase large subunit
MTQTKFGVSQSVRRREDAPLLRGQGRYVADIPAEGALQAVVVRSPHAHARFAIDASAARAMPGVRLVLTGEDVAELGLLPCLAAPPGLDPQAPPYPVLPREEVRHVGDAVAFVIADTLEAAKDGAEAVALDWTALPHVVGSVAALSPGAPQVWAHKPGNAAFDLVLGDAVASAAAFKTAAKVVALTVVNQRLVTNYMDTRGVVAEYDADTQRFTLTLSSQGPHLIRDVLAENVFGIDADKFRVLTPDVGGGFGTKFFPYREYALAAFAAKKLGKPVRWIGDRSEHFLGDTHGRDNVTTGRLALDDKGRFLALDFDLVADMGAYLSCYAPYIPYAGALLLPGVYDVPLCAVRVRGVYTNTVPVDAYRGAGRPEAAYVLERLVDTAAREIGVAPDALRKRNFIKPKAMPYRTATGKTYDSGEFAAHMARAMEVADWTGFSRRHAAAKKAGKLRGIALATYVEACGAMGAETAVVNLDDDGGVTVTIGTQSSGQGHLTAYAQLIAEHLDLPPERVRLVQGDTDRVKTGNGTGGSSSIPCGGASVAGAARKLADNLKKLAADQLEAAAGDIEIADGTLRIAGTDRAVSFADLARAANTDRTLLTTADAFAPSEATYPNGTHVVEVEVDPDTGAVDVVNYVVVDDFGVSLNPLLLEGQIVGGIAQGLGQALMERTVYDADSGQLLSASLQDYALPRATDMPVPSFETRNVRCLTNPLGVKGAGEAGTIGACPAIMNAVVDALWRGFRIRHLDMPATPERVWTAIAEARRMHTL